MDRALQPVVSVQHRCLAHRRLQRSRKRQRRLRDPRRDRHRRPGVPCPPLQQRLLILHRLRGGRPMARCEGRLLWRLRAANLVGRRLEGRPRLGLEQGRLMGEVRRPGVRVRRPDARAGSEISRQLLLPPGMGTGGRLERAKRDDARQLQPVQRGADSAALTVRVRRGRPPLGEQPLR